VDAFDSVSIDGLAKATVIVGAGPRVRVRGDDNMVGFVRTRVTRGELRVSVDAVFTTSSEPLEVTIYAPELDSLDLDGAVSAEVTGFDGGDFSLTADGATHVELDGNVECFIAEVNGASSIDGTDFSTECADITANGASEIELAVRESLTLALDGASSLRVRGQPRIVSQRVEGASSLEIGE